MAPDELASAVLWEGLVVVVVVLDLHRVWGVTRGLLEVWWSDSTRSSVVLVE